MTVLVLALAMLAAALAALAVPLFGPAPAPLGLGLEDAAPVARWEGERARLVAAMRDNDLALAEGRLDSAVHQSTASRLAAEAERVLSRLRAARGQFQTPVQVAEIAPRKALSHLAVMGLVLVVAVLSARAAGWQDINLVGSPHADGSIPLEGAVPPMATGEGMPDIGAMVAGLEARVAQGDATAEEIKMLLRSYDTLGRLADARPVLQGALARFPADPEFRLGWLRLVVSLPEPGDAAGALTLADGLIAEIPDLLEARWYRSLLLVGAARRDEALAELRGMAPLLPADSPAGRAVAGLIADLETLPVPTEGASP